VTTLARRAMDRENARVYDPVIVVDTEGAIVGSVTMKALIERSIELRVRTAQSANPLTGLPGNQAIQKWITRFAQVTTLDVVYADLDRFKEYNDQYGFLMGDEMIRLASRVLTRCLVADRKDGFLGHIGGDDFVAVFPTGVTEDALSHATSAFDEEKASLFEPEELENGFLPAVNRRGELEHVPLVTVSLAVVRRANIQGTIHPAMLSQLAATLKEKVKQKAATEGRSSFIIERRYYSDSSLRPPSLDAFETLIESPLLVQRKIDS
jgi:diguanylate cyclase (GGDEF)-like protein